MDLTTQQKSRLRKAYRGAFEAESYGQAMVTLYERFTALYGMTVDEIRDFLADEWAKRDMQAILAAAVAKPADENCGASASPGRLASNPNPSVRPPKKHKKKSANLARRALQLPRGKVVCPVCGRLVGRGGLDQHKSPNRHWCNGVTPLPSKREKRTCRFCKQWRGVRQTDGRMVSHKGKDGQKCEGSGRTPFEGRSVAYVTVASAKVVGSGLPGLGKRR